MDDFNSATATGDQNSEHPPIFRLEDDTWCLLIAMIQIMGGVVGAGLFIYQYGSAPYSLIMSLILSPFLWGIYGGIMLWNGKDKGLNYSLIMQAIQIPKLMTPLLGYHVFLGAEANVGWFGSMLKLDWTLGSSAFLYLNTELTSYGAGINLIPLAAFVYLMKFKRKQNLLPDKNSNVEADD